MNDEQIERALRQGPPDEPALGSATADSVRAGPRRGAARVAPGLGLVAAAIAVLTLAVVLPMRVRDNQGGAVPPAIRSADLIRIGVSSTSPQVLVNGRLQGFDVDVARELGARLGVRVQVSSATTSALLAGDLNRWDVVLAAPPASPDAAIELAGRAYATRHGAIVTRIGAPDAMTGGLDGMSVCAVDDGAGDSWLAGSITNGTAIRPPSGVTLRPAPRLEDCLASVSAGAVEAVIADWDYEVLVVPPGVEVQSGVPFAVRSAPFVATDRAGSRDLMGAINDALDGMRSDGTLASLSRHWFAGRDITSTP